MFIFSRIKVDCHIYEQIIFIFFVRNDFNFADIDEIGVCVHIFEEALHLVVCSDDVGFYAADVVQERKRRADFVVDGVDVVFYRAEHQTVHFDVVDDIFEHRAESGYRLSAAG